MDLAELEPLSTEIIESQGLQIKHHLHCIEDTELSRLSVPGFGEWVLIVVEDQLWTLSLKKKGLPEKMRQKFCWISAQLPNRDIDLHEIIESFVAFLIESFSEIDQETN